MYPILFSIGDLHFRAWGLFVGLGIIAGLLLTIRLAKGTKYTEEVFTDFLLYAIFAGLIGARIWDVIFSWDQYAANPLHALMLWEGGLSIQGAVIANVLLALWYIRRKGLSFWKFADYAAPGLILGQALGRIGCFFNGDAYGKPTDAWYGVIYQPGTPAYMTWGSTPLVPAELFEAAIDIGILAVLLRYSKNKKFDGYVTLLYFALYSLARFGLEFLRSDSLMVGDWKVAQITALISAAAAILMILRKTANRAAA